MVSMDLFYVYENYFEHREEINLPRTAFVRGIFKNETTVCILESAVPLIGSVTNEINAGRKGTNYNERTMSMQLL